MPAKPKRRCKMCGVVVQPRRHYCDWCLKQKRLAHQRETHRARYQNDPEFAERKRQSRRDSYWKKRETNDAE